MFQMGKAIILTLALLIISIGILRAGEYRDRGSWKKTLIDKAEYFENNTEKRHNIEGIYPSSIRLTPPKYYAGSQQDAWNMINTTGELPPGWIVNHGPNGMSNIAHSSSWTGNLLTAEAFRVAFLKKKFGENSSEYKKAYDRANEVISGILKLTLVSGQPGYLARGFALGHGATYGERQEPGGESGTRDLWKQGVGELSYLRYRGGPSHHNYDQVFRGLGFYYFLAADEKQKEVINAIVTDMSNWVHVNHNMMVMHLGGEKISTELIGGYRGLGGKVRPSDGSLLAITGLKIAYMITGNEKTKDLYDHWVDALGYRELKDSGESIMGPARGNWDDTDHLLADLYLLNIIEKDEDLLAYYKKCVKDSWEVHKDDKISWYNFIYRAVLGEEYGDKEGSIWNLQTFPTNRLFQPRMNSIRTDIEFVEHNGRKEALHPLPSYERVSDNEFEWKGSPYRLDGWTSRIVKTLEVSADDPFVQFAADNSGRAYYSNTNGEVWHLIDQLSNVNDILISPDYPWLIFAASKNGLFRTMNGSKTWSKTSTHSFDHLSLDNENTHVIYAVNNKGIYKSRDFGENTLGTKWNLISGNTPSGKFAVDPRGDTEKFFMFTQDGVYTKTYGDNEWNSPKPRVRLRGFSELEVLPGRAEWIRVDMKSKNRLFRSVSISESELPGNLICFSEDDGNTWSPIVREIAPLVNWLNKGNMVGSLTETDLRKYLAIAQKFAVADIVVSNKNPNTWFGSLKNGVAVTHDAGKTWTISSKGLDIPIVNTIWIPRHSDNIYIGTPAGMYISHDECESWNDTSLILQESNGSAERSEIGGVGYLNAYWMGRYHNYIDENEATDKWWED